jgi:hypothetical protein
MTPTPIDSKSAPPETASPTPVDPHAGKTASKSLYRQLFDFSMLLLAVIALGLATVQFWDSKEEATSLKEQATSLKEQATRLQEISMRISTQSAGDFPANMDAIIRVVAGTKKSIKIMADLAGYGEFSKPPLFDKYLAAITNARRAGYDVKLLIYDGPAAREDIKLQFKLPENFPALEKLPAYTEFFGMYHPGLTKPSNSNDLLKTLLQREKDIRKSLRDDTGIQYHLAAAITDIPFFLWLRDGGEAVFSLYNLGHNVREVSFYTNDGKLTKSFDDIFDELYDKWKKQSETPPQ